MKKTAALFMSVLLLLSCLSACASRSSGKDTSSDSGKLSIVTTIFPPYDFARAVAGDMADVTMLLAPGEETHTYDPSPADIIKIQNCDLFVYGGGESDTWVDGVLDSLDTDISTVAMMDVCPALEEEAPEGMQSEEAGKADGETEYDEHVWTSPKNAVKIVNAICDSLCVLDPDNAEAYRSNASNYVSSLEELDGKFQSIVDSAKRNTIVFGDRFPLLYFVREYGLNYYAAFPGCASNTEPSAATVAFLIDKVREENIPVVFKIELSNGQTADSIAESVGNGTVVRTFYTCHNVSKDDFENGETYISLMERNLDTLTEALN